MATSPQRSLSAIDWKAKLSSLTQAVTLINGTGNIEAILENLVATACKQVGWALGSIMSIDAEHGFAYVMARHDPTLIQRTLPDRWELATSPSLIALQRNQPIYVPDIRESDEFHGYRIESYERDYRSILVIPMNCVDFNGRPMVLNLLSRQVSELSDEDQAVLDMVVQLGVTAVEQERRVQAARQDAERQQMALATHTALLDHALTDSSVLSLSELVNARLHVPLVIVDFTMSQVVPGRSPDQRRFTDRQWQAEVQRVFGPQLLKVARDTLERSGNGKVSIRLDDGADAIRIEGTVQALEVDADRVGALVVFDQDAAPDLMELMVLDSARFALSVVMMRNFIRFRFETRTQSELFYEIIERRWRDAGDLLLRAQRLGLDFERRQQMLVVDLGGGERVTASMTVDLHRALTRFVQAQGAEVSVLSVDGAMVCLCPLAEDDPAERTAKLAERVAREVGRYLGQTPVVVASQPCQHLGDYPEAWERARRVVEIARSLGRTGALSLQDFGPMPMLAAAAGVDEVRLFLSEVLGQVVEHDRENDTPYLETLEIYLRERGRSQAAADAMGLHVTTLRYRLKRIEELFGINVEAPDRRFSVELAIQLQKMMTGV